MNTPFTPETAASEIPCTSGSYDLVVKAARQLVDIASDSIIAQHKLTQTLLKRQEMVTAHLEQIERLMNRDNHAAYEGEHEQVMAEHRFLDALTAKIGRDNDATVTRFGAVTQLLEGAQ